jgi:phenylacetate-CoA ligase
VSLDPADAERYPTLSEHGRRMLEFLREHPHAPLYRNHSGNKLTTDEVARVRAFEREVHAASIDWAPGRPPGWLGELIERCFTLVPFYRRLGSPPATLADVPCVSRAELSRDIAAFVPDDVATDRLIHFRTSGTTGHPLLLASHPVVAASYLAFHKRALARAGIELRHGRGQVGVVLVGYQRSCFTYVSVTPTMDESGLAKINLIPDEWRHPDDRARYLDALAPEVYAGDPVSLAELANLPLATRPRALLSTSMALSEGLRERLERRFECPVLDLYSMNEAGPIAVFDRAAGGHVLLQRRLYVEILDAEGRAVADGARGEVVLSGGFNFCLPLLRYRTGDFAALVRDRGELVLIGLEGRPPVRYRTSRGAWINNIDVTHALARFAIPQYTLCQARDGGVDFRFSGTVDAAAVQGALHELFGDGQRLTVSEVTSFDGKVVQYTSALDGSQP